MRVALLVIHNVVTVAAAQPHGAGSEPPPVVFERLGGSCYSMGRWRLRSGAVLALSGPCGGSDDATNLVSIVSFTNAGPIVREYHGMGVWDLGDVVLGIEAERRMPTSTPAALALDFDGVAAREAPDPRLHVIELDLRTGRKRALRWGTVGVWTAGAGRFAVVEWEDRGPSELGTALLWDRQRNAVSTLGRLGLGWPQAEQNEIVVWLDDRRLPIAIDGTTGRIRTLTEKRDEWDPSDPCMTAACAFSEFRVVPAPVWKTREGRRILLRGPEGETLDPDTVPESEVIGFDHDVAFIGGGIYRWPNDLERVERSHAP